MKTSLSIIALCAVIASTPVLASPQGGQAGGVDGTGRGSRAEMDARNGGYCGGCRQMEENARTVTETSRAGSWGVEGGFSPAPNVRGSYQSGTTERSIERSYGFRDRGVDSFGRDCACSSRDRTRDGGGGATGRW